MGAWAQYSNTSSPVDVTTRVTWSSSNEAVATVDSGKVTGTGRGVARIIATLDGVSNHATVLVDQPPLKVTVEPPGPFSIAVSSSQQFQAMATYPDEVVLEVTGAVTWSASPEGIVYFDGPWDYSGAGVGTFLATGKTTITATLNEVSGSIAVEVKP